MEHDRRERCSRLFGSRLANDRQRQGRDNWNFSAAVQDVPLNEEQARIVHRTIREVTQDIRRLSFNTAIAKMMEFTNFFTGGEVRPREAMEKIVLLLSPLAPHIAEELWELLGHKKTLAYEPWPTFDEAKIKESSLEIPVQILGKVRGRVVVPADADDAAIESAARADEKIAAIARRKDDREGDRREEPAGQLRREIAATPAAQALCDRTPAIIFDRNALQPRLNPRAASLRTIILCGGLGTRLREETEYRPKPMVEVGGRPVLWHIMKTYAHYGLNDFVLCVGYKGSVIKEYFLNCEALSNDFTIRFVRRTGD
ncbi:MAG: class I tRNA ligase family protein [Pirellulales bacterium]